MEINLKELLKAEFGVDFPISGGTGNSRDNPIIVHRVIPNTYSAIEYGILRCLGIGRKIQWKIIQQTIVYYNGKTLDQLQIETKQLKETEIITQIENYYFDITDCVDLY